MAEDMSPYVFSIVISLIESATTALVALLFAVLFWYKLRAQSRSRGHDNFNALSTWMKTTRISAVCIFVCLFLSTLSMAILMIAQLLTHHLYSEEDLLASILFASLFGFLILWYASSYIFMLARLVSTFQDSAYCIRKCVIYGHIAYICCFVVGEHILYGLNSIGIDGVKPKLALAVNVLFYVVGLVHLGYEFNHRLFLLMLTQRQTIVAGGIRTLTDRQRKMLKVIRKNTLLASVQIAAVMITGIAYATSLFATHFSYTPFEVYPVSHAYLAVVQLMKLCVFFVSSWSVYLGFNVNENDYDKLCKQCDSRCERCFEAKTHHILNEYVSLNSH